MTISFVGSTSSNAANGANVTADLTNITGLAEDDYVIFAYGIGGFENYTMSLVSPTGSWTTHSTLYQDDVRDSNLGVFSKVMGATVDTAVTGDGGATSGRGVACVAMAFRGVDTTTPQDVTRTEAQSADSYRPDPPSITYSTSGAAVVIIGAGAHVRAGHTTTWPTGYTTNPLHDTGDSSTDISVAVAYNLSPSTPENPGVITFDDADDATYSWCAVTMALRPSGGVSIIPLIQHHRRQMQG